MKKSKWIIFSAVAVAAILTTSVAVFAADAPTKSGKLAQREAALEEKLENGEITQEQYDEIIAGIESGEFRSKRGFGGFKGGIFGGSEELTDEQKAALEEKRAEITENGSFDGFKGGFFGRLEELTDEQKAEIEEKRAEITENGRFGGFRGSFFGNTEGATDEQTDDSSEAWSGIIGKGSFGAFRGNRSNSPLSSL